jgi:hypothetical protein
MRVLFLDFDGVLNSVRFFGADSKRGYRRARRIKYELPHEAIDPAAVACLNAIVERTGAKVVVSSTWRTVFGCESIAVFLERRGFVGEVVGCTPQIKSAQRGEEIAAWIADEGPVDAFAILDDHADMAHLKPRLVQTDTATGLLPEHVERVVALLAA